MAVDIAKLIELASELQKLIGGISNEIKKEANAKRRKKMWKATNDLLADPSADGLAAYREKLHQI